MTKEKRNKILIIGGGAAGIMAAIASRQHGAEVTILERNARIGKKILATGNGRCNLTNENMEISRYHGRHPEFVYGAFSRFGYDRTIEFFEDLGIHHKVEDGGKVFPTSNQASSVLDVLRYELEALDVKIICDVSVKDVVKRKHFEVTSEDGRVFKGDKLILAAGGKASPNLGSNGSGYLLAQKLGHKIIDPFPALVQLKLSSKFLKQIQGIKFDGEAEIIVNDRVIRNEAGEILFTEYGISGPPILQLSRKASEFLSKNQKVYLRVKLVSYMSREQLEELILRRLRTGAMKPLSFNFVGFLNKKLVPVVLKEAGIEDINKPSGNVTSYERKRIVDILQDWRFEVTGTKQWDFAQVTAGGVDVKEVNGKTMESRIVPGLYFAGEILDIDGDCGGYNLQWAWSSGYVAGESAAGAIDN